MVRSTTTRRSASPCSTTAGERRPLPGSPQRRLPQPPRPDRLGRAGGCREAAVGDPGRPAQAPPTPGHYDLDHLRAFHWTIFQDVYPWAGQLRTVLIVKAGASFCLPHQIVETAAEVFGRLAAADHLRGRDRDGFLDGLVPLLAEINALHPFREGNGRT